MPRRCLENGEELTSLVGIDRLRQALRQNRSRDSKHLDLEYGQAKIIIKIQ